MQTNTVQSPGIGGLSFPYPTVEQLRLQKQQAASGPADAGAQQAAAPSPPAGDQAGQATLPADPPKPAKRQRQPAAKKAKPAAPAKQRTSPLSMADRFRVMKAIEAADPTESDVSIAARISPTLPRPITGQLIGVYREELGLAPVKELSRAELRARLVEAERLLAEARQGKLPLEGGGSPDDVMVPKADVGLVQVGPDSAQ